MPTRSFTIYEVPNSYVFYGTGPNGGSPTISGKFTMSVVDNNNQLQATPGGAGAGQIISVNGAQVNNYQFFYNDNIAFNGSTVAVKTFQLTINGTTRSFIMNSSTNNIPGANVGSSYSLDNYKDYTNLKYKKVACFVRATLIETDRGPKLVEDLKLGDRVRTLDHGYQPICWIGTTALSLRNLLLRPDLRPVLIPAGSLGKGLPTRDLRVSPQHRVLLGGWEVQLNFGQDQVLAPAKALVGKRGICVDKEIRQVDYFHFMFDRHEVVFSEGLPSESFLVGDTIRDDMDMDQLDEILALFPELASRQSANPVLPARSLLKNFEARILEVLAA